MASSAPSPAPPPPPPPLSSASPARPQKICFNGHCKEPLLDQHHAARRKGWRLRSGEIADLCDRCSCAYEQGSFCETFHSEISGWRNCESCGKRVHCGCIVSASSYILLDAGGVDCVVCARKSLTMASNQMLASPVLMHQNTSERRDFASKSWRPLNGPFSGQWRQTTHMWNLTSAQSDLQQRLSYEFDRPNNVEKLIPGGRHPIPAHENKFVELPDRLASSSLGTVPRDRYINGATGPELVSFGAFRREDANADVLSDPKHSVGGQDLSSIRRSMIPDPCTTSSSAANPSLCINPQLSSTIKEEPTSLLTGLVASVPSTTGSRDPRFPMYLPQGQASPSSTKQFFPQGVAVDAELHAQMLNGRNRFDGRARAPMLPRYWPRITDQELQQISGDKNSVITPLFEKMLSASDAGRIGRLVLPKKCAETYFPAISHPEGLPLKVQDANGKEWVFQFRFWPNNNSRMYVLEGVTPCIQSMQLQAGDIVTFSRIDPEGKLVMGFRKASSASSEQEPQTNKSGNGFSASSDSANKIPVVDLVANVPPQITKPSIEPKSSITTSDQASWSKTSGTNFIQKDASGAKSLQNPARRKSSTPGSKTKRLRIENEDAMELKVTWEEAQELLRPAADCAPTVVKIEGFDFEEYEQAPVIGKRTYFTTNKKGKKSQWAQCEDCSKWRKLPVDALLPSRWTCSANLWDPERNMCSVAEEINFEQLADLIYSKTGTSKRSRVKLERENVELSDGLDTLANLAILGEGENLATTSQQTTKHPRHRPGCTCIVCIQPPSGKGPKHKQTCTCNVCLTVKRRFRTLLLRREKRQSEKDAEKAEKPEKTEISKKQKQLPTSLVQSLRLGSDLSSTAQGVNSPQNTVASNNLTNDGPEHKTISQSPLKAPQIDLNIQPEREEESSPNATS